MNIYLTGMMGSGKSVIGSALAAQREMDFIDLDAYIEEKEALSIPEIFARHGETGFRERETRALQEVARSEDQIIATGGGIILRDCNIQCMQETGLIVFIDRSVEAIVDDILLEDRPVLQGDLSKVQEVHKNRFKRYTQTCDIQFSNHYAEIEQAMHALHIQLNELSM